MFPVCNNISTHYKGSCVTQLMAFMEGKRRERERERDDVSNDAVAALR